MKWVLFVTLGVLIGVSLLPVEATQPTSFADPSFQRYYARTGPTVRTLLWGGPPLLSIVEPYVGAPGNRRLVQYFDRGRMELNQATGEVTQGLLVRELATGLVQVGDDAFTQDAPAAIPIMATSANGGEDAGPTYADFGLHTLERAEDRTRAVPSGITAWLLPGGEIVASPAPAAVAPALYVEQTGHNLPDVFAAWLASDPFSPLSWHEALGYPISEPYWVQAGGAARLVQLFERRVIVYTPSAPEGERFTLTNVGRHYYRWRYGDDPSATTRPRQPVAPESDRSSGLVLPDGYQVTTVLTEATDIVDLAVAPDGRVLVAHASGTVTVVDAEGAKETPLLEGLNGPVAVVSVNTTIYVVDSAGLHRIHDHDGDGTIDAIAAPVALPFDVRSIVLSAGPEGMLYLAGVERGAAPSGQALVMRWDEARATLERVPAFFDADGIFVVDVSGVLWAAEPAGELVRITLDARADGVLSLQGIGAPTPTGAVQPAGVHRAIRDLILYRPDGAIGDPMHDMLALVRDAEGGRIVRLRPASSRTPTATTLSGAIVDFITGFSDPVAAVAGLDGSLYVADDGRGVLYRITPP